MDPDWNRVENFEMKISLWTKLHASFNSNTFISKARLKLAKNQANAKQHPETELSLFENCFIILYQRYHPKIIRHSKK